MERNKTVTSRYGPALRGRSFCWCDAEAAPPINDADVVDVAALALCGLIQHTDAA
jgi:hypothetical protein